MKMKSGFRLAAKLLLLLAIAVIFPLLPSCGHKAKMDAAGLLKTVPSSAGVVAAINVESISVKTGGEFPSSFGTVKIGNGIEKMINGGVVVFKDAYDGYATFFLSDTPAFMESVSKGNGNDFQEADGVKVSGNVAVNGAQAWINLTGPSIDVRALKNYASLSESQSFLSNPYSGNFVDTPHDIVAWGLLNDMLKAASPLVSLPPVGMFAGMLFENPDALGVSVDFEKGEMNVVAGVLNAGGKAAKYLLPAEKIDVDAVKSLAGSADMIGAAAVPKSLVKKLLKLASTFGGSFVGLQEEALKPIDGTVAFASGRSGDFKMPVTGFVTTDGKQSTELMNLLSNVGATKIDGDFIRFSDGEVSGVLDVAATASEFKDATVAFAIGSPESGSGRFGWVDGVRLCLFPEKGGLSLKVVVKAREKSENVLKAIVGDLNK